jgi:hypothetical protein
LLLGESTESRERKGMHEQMEFGWEDNTNTQSGLGFIWTCNGNGYDECWYDNSLLFSVVLYLLSVDISKLDQLWASFDSQRRKEKIRLAWRWRGSDMDRASMPKQDGR